MKSIRPCIEFICSGIKGIGLDDLAVASLPTPVLPTNSPPALEVISSIRKVEGSNAVAVSAPTHVVTYMV